ncbi:MAG: 50S ribosomal protein L9 [Bacteroidales bacterium]|nr:50S ribosomal protein L9 [Bacteroidales bacterium]HOK98283.1 50S ribosomal protein L9 [Bacteroidales bacterium]HPO65161.1 50S ribosomal protein L9 [Bacteroidales bacterium]
MEIILKQDVKNLGSKDDIVTVKDGYARNFLIPKGLAIVATPSAKKMHAEIIRQRAHKEEKLRQEALQLAEKMKGLKLTIGAKTSSKGKIFGSVNTIQISEALNAQGFDIDRKNIYIKEEVIKEVGNYTAKVKLHKEVYVEIPFEVVSE